jgi:predicted nucleic acid-binding Zn ribbon protein
MAKLDPMRTYYGHAFRCKGCGTRFEVMRLTADPARVKVPPCPRKTCRGKVKQSYMSDVGFNAADGKAPAVGGTDAVRAYDIAMDAGAANAGLTDLNDKPRYGENSAPKLPPNLAAQVQNFWGPSQKGSGMQRRARANVGGLLRGPTPAAPAPSPTFQFSSDSAMMPIHSRPEDRPKVIVEAAYPGPSP